MVHIIVKSLLTMKILKFVITLCFKCGLHLNDKGRSVKRLSRILPDLSTYTVVMSIV